MVFRCDTCKSRRVKCDAVQPTCSRCKKAGRTCTWNPNDYVADTGLHFRIENNFAGGQPRRPKKVKQPLPLPEKHTNFSPAEITTLPAHALDVQAFHYWMENFMFRMEDLPEFGNEYNAYVLSYWARAQPGSSLHLALFAFSHSVYGRANHVPKAIEDADRAHARALVKMQTDMEDMNRLSNEMIDQLLVTTMLMSSYQNIMYGQQNPPASNEAIDEVGSRLWKSLCHHEGALALLKLRRQQGSVPSLPIHRMVRRQVVRTCILRGAPVPDWLEDGVEYQEENPILDFDALLVQVAALRARSLPVLYSKDGDVPSDTRSSEDLATDALDLDIELAKWSEALLAEWRFSMATKETEAFDREFIYKTRVHIYLTHGHAAIWNRYRASRIIVNSIRIRALSIHIQTLNYPSQRSFVSIQQEECHKNIESLANDMCYGIPFFFNFPDPTTENPRSRSLKLGKYSFRTDAEIIPKFAGLIAWPLAVAVSTEFVPEHQREWLKNRLKVVACSFGDAVLESIVEQGEFRF